MSGFILTIPKHPEEVTLDLIFYGSFEGSATRRFTFVKGFSRFCTRLHPLRAYPRLKGSERDTLLEYSGISYHVVKGNSVCVFSALTILIPFRQSCHIIPMKENSMLSLLTTGIADSHLHSPEDTPYPFIFFLFLLMIRFYLFISQKSTPPSPLDPFGRSYKFRRNFRSS